MQAPLGLDPLGCFLVMSIPAESVAWSLCQPADWWLLQTPLPVLAQFDFRIALACIVTVYANIHQAFLPLSLEDRRKAEAILPPQLRIIHVFKYGLICFHILFHHF